MFRRLVFAIAAVVCDNFPFLQIQLLIYSTLLVILYLGVTKPFEEPFLNKLEIFNEICVLGVGYHLLLFTDFIPDVTI
jgi:hypothetical protein